MWADKSGSSKIIDWGVSFAKATAPCSIPSFSSSRIPDIPRTSNAALPYASTALPMLVKSCPGLHCPRSYTHTNPNLMLHRCVKSNPCCGLLFSRECVRDSMEKGLRSLPVPISCIKVSCILHRLLCMGFTSSIILSTCSRVRDLVSGTKKKAKMAQRAQVEPQICGLQGLSVSVRWSGPAA